MADDERTSTQAHALVRAIEVLRLLRRGSFVMSVAMHSEPSRLTGNQ